MLRVVVHRAMQHREGDAAAAVQAIRGGGAAGAARLGRSHGWPLKQISDRLSGSPAICSPGRLQRERMLFENGRKELSTGGSGDPVLLGPLYRGGKPRGGHVAGLDSSRRGSTFTPAPYRLVEAPAVPAASSQPPDSALAVLEQKLSRSSLQASTQRC